MSQGYYLRVPTAAADAEAYRTGQRGPGVLFLIDALGLRPSIEEMADRIASWGYVVLVPNIFHRTGTVAEMAPDRDLRTPQGRESFFATVRPRMEALTPDRQLADLQHYLGALKSLDGVSAGPIGATGYCLGARLATCASGLDADIAAVGGFHGGRLATDDPQSPHLSLRTAHAEFVYGHADNDASMPPEQVSRLGQALDAQGLVNTNEVYQGAAHGYSMADTSSYDRKSAERSFAELEALFGRRLQ